MKTNIVLIGLLEDVTKQISEKLSLDFGLYYADIEGIIQYNLMNEKEVKKLCGIEYLNNLKHKFVKDIANYENAIISMPYGIFSKDNNSELYKANCTIVFLNFKKKILEEQIEQCETKKMKKEKQVLLLAYEERTKFCSENSDVVINFTSANFDRCYKKVKKQLDKYYI